MSDSSIDNLSAPEPSSQKLDWKQQKEQQAILRKKENELNEKNGFVLDDESLKYIYQFKLKPVQPEAENEK